jgi:hypothetical protein
MIVKINRRLETREGSAARKGQTASKARAPAMKQRWNVRYSTGKFPRVFVEKLFR